MGNSDSNQSNQSNQSKPSKHNQSNRSKHNQSIIDLTDDLTDLTDYKLHDININGVVFDYANLKANSIRIPDNIYKVSKSNLIHFKTILEVNNFGFLFGN